MIKLSDIIEDLGKEQADLEEVSFKKALATAALGAGLAFGGGKATAQKAAEPTATTQNVTLSSLGAKFANDWNMYRDWASKTTIDDIDGSGDTSRLLDVSKPMGQQGNPKLDKASFRDKMIATYEKANPKSDALKPENIRKFQAAMVAHRKATIASDKTGGIKLAGGKYQGTDYSDYLPHVKKIGDKAEKEGDFDGFPGRYTTETFASGKLEPIGKRDTLKRTDVAPSPK